MIRIKRVYEQPTDKDGLRMLVNRLWPRGLSRKCHLEELEQKEKYVHEFLAKARDIGLTLLYAAKDNTFITL